MNNVIEIKKLTKKYDNLFSLGEINLNIPSGCIIGLIGENGAGKTTLIKSMLNIIRPDNGNVKIFNKDSIKYDYEVKKDIGIVLDDMFFPEILTANDINSIMKDIYKNWDKDLYFDYLKKFKLPNNKAIKTMSKGMRKKLEIVTALAHHPKLLILDEPTSGLDPIVRVHIKNALSDLIEDNNSLIIISSHNLKELEDICDSYGILENGHIETYGDLLESKANINKYQLAFKEEVDIEMFKDFDVLYKNMEGRIITLVIRGNREEVSEKLEAFNPLILDVLNVNFEELFIYEHTGALNVK